MSNSFSSPPDPELGCGPSSDDREGRGGDAEETIEQGIREVFEGIFGRTPEDVLDSRGAARSEDVCDHLDCDELMFVTFGEFMATRLIESRNARGNAECLRACRDAARIVRRAFEAT